MGFRGFGALGEPGGRLGRQRPRHAIFAPSRRGGAAVLRTHRLLREMTRERKRRRGRLSPTTNPLPSLAPLRGVLRSLEADGVIPIEALDDLEDRMSSAFLNHIEETGAVAALAQHVSDVVLGDRVYKLSLSRQLGVAANAVALTAVEERVVLAAAIVCRRVADSLFEAEPTLPSEACLARSIAEGVVPWNYVELRDRDLLHRYHNLKRLHPDWTVPQLADAVQAGLDRPDEGDAAPDAAAGTSEGDETTAADDEGGDYANCDG